MTNRKALTGWLALVAISVLPAVAQAAPHDDIPPWCLENHRCADGKGGCSLAAPPSQGAAEGFLLLGLGLVGFALKRRHAKRSD
jgi:hypothetical protein